MVEPPCLSQWQTVSTHDSRTLKFATFYKCVGRFEGNSWDHLSVIRGSFFLCFSSSLSGRTSPRSPSACRFLEPGNGSCCAEKTVNLLWDVRRRGTIAEFVVLVGNQDALCADR